MVYTASWKTCTFLFKENPIKADEEELDSAGHYTRRLESEFVPRVLIVSETPSVTEALCQHQPCLYSGTHCAIPPLGLRDSDPVPENLTRTFSPVCRL